MTLLTVNYKSAQVTALESSPRKVLNTKESRGRVRYFKGYYKNETGSTLASGSIIALANIDAPGVILPDSVVFTTAFGASRTLDVGFQEYKNTEGVTVADDIDALRVTADVSAAGSFTLNAAIQGVEVTGPVQVLARINGGTLPANGEIAAHIFVVMD